MDRGHLVSDRRIVGSLGRGGERSWRRRKRGRKYNSRIIFGMDGDVEEERGRGQKQRRRGKLRKHESQSESTTAVTMKLKFEAPRKWKVGRLER